MQLMSLPHAGAYRVVYADPAWTFKTYGRGINTKGAAHHYRVSPLEEMQALPVAQLAAPDAWLVMWTTWPHLMNGDAFRLAEAWSDPANPWIGSTGGAWGKRPRGWRGRFDRWSMGTGFVLRSACEPLLLFRRGQPDWNGDGERNFWAAPIRRHSQKPDEVRAMLLRATSGPRVELFARQRVDGFDAWGDELS